MKLLELHIDGFGKFHDQTISFTDGVNIIYGRNEAGKSTIHTFIRGMLFGMERGRGRAARNDLYSKYEPWENGGTYAGWLRLESDGTVYRLERKFRKDDKAFRVINENLGREEEVTRAFMDQILSGLNETTYNNTISIGQLKSATEEGMVNELKNYIANLNTTGNLALNITKATAYLRNEKRAVEANLSPEASREYTSLLAEIRTLDSEISSPEYENQLAAYQNMRSQVKGVIETTQTEKDALSEKIVRGKQVLEEAGFTDQSSVNEYVKGGDDLYARYKNLEGETRKKSRKIFSNLALFAALICACEAGVLFSIDWSANLALGAVSIGGAGVLAAIGLFLQSRGRELERTLKDTGEELGELLKKHLGDPAVSEAAMEAFHGRMAEFSKLCQMVAQSEEEVRKFMDDLNSLKTKQNSCSEMIEKQQRTQWELEKKLEQLAACKTRAKALQKVLAETDRRRDELAASEMAQEVMTGLSSSIRDSFGLYLNKEASRMIKGITGGIYDSMSVDENLNVFLNTRTRLAPLESVSSGTMDQVYLALRLAAARLLTGKEDSMPLLFDDSFTQYDDERLKTALKWLSGAYSGQMLLFTCHRREAAILKDAGSKFNLIEVS